MRRVHAVPATMADVSLIAGLAATGMILVFGLIYLASALVSVDPFML